MKKITAYRAALALFMGLALPLKALSLGRAGASDMVLAIILGAGQSTGLFLACRSRRARPAALLLAGTLAWSWGGIACLGALVDPDFFKLLFHAFFSAYLAVLVRADLFLTKSRKRRLLAARLSLLFMVAIAGWILVVACVLIIGKSARAADSILFNLYNTIFLALGYLEYLRLREAKTLAIGPGYLLFEDFHLENFFGPGDTELLLLFLERAGEPLNCSEIATRLRIGEAPDPGRCRECRLRDYKATSCTYYRSLYNRVLALKKFMEAFDLGSIHGPNAKPAVKKDGWRLDLKSTVRIVDRRE